jgi:type II secretory pathway pseudopilin PulG
MLLAKEILVMPARTGFVLVELIAVAMVALVLGALLLIMSAEVRRNARLGEDLANLRQFGVITQSYAADSADRFWTFSWKAGHQNSQFPDLNGSSSDQQAAADQAVDIIRRRSVIDQPRLNLWIPHLSFNTLVLAGYLDRQLPMRFTVSSADRERLLWHSDPLTAPIPRFSVSSSYAPSPVFISSPQSGPFALRQGQSSAFWQYAPNYTLFGAVQMSSVAFPSQKVLFYDHMQRHFERDAFYAETDARVALLMADGAAGVRATVDANPGWQPTDPTNPEPSAFWYHPPSGPNSLWVQGQYRWTRMGLQGRDFGGPEVWP